MTRIERKLMLRSIAWGVAVTLTVVVFDQVGALQPLERWLYDRRARECQFFMVPPTDQLIHVDIDDKALGIITPAWPWPRSYLAGIVDELNRAGAKVIALDILFPEQQMPRWVRQPDDTFVQVDDDAVLAGALRQHGRVILATDPDLPPIESLRQAAAATGLVKHQTSADGVLRSVPLLYQSDNQRQVQLGLALAAMFLDIDLASIVHEHGSVVLQDEQNQRNIPVRTGNATDELTAFVNVPWFGSSGGEHDWATMYDQPNYENEQAQRISILSPWQLANSRRILQENNAIADSVLRTILTTLNPARVDDIPATPEPDPARGALIREVLETLAFQIESMSKADDLSSDEQQFLRDCTFAQEKLLAIETQNAALNARIAEKEPELVDAVNGKAVLVGWTATGAAADFVPTSLHAKCPGVVVHGTVFNAIMTGELWRRPPAWITVALTLVLGLLATVVVARLGPIWAAMSAIALIAAHLVFNGVVLFDYGNVIIGAAGPLVAVLVVWSTCTVMRFVSERAERRRITRRFQNYVDPALVNYVLEHPEQARLKGQVRELTVVFTDLAGFTTLTEQLGEKTVSILNDYMALMVPVIRRHNGYLNKFLGDGIMFFFGAPQQSSLHAADAIATVLEMYPTLDKFNVTLAEQGLPTVSMRAGVSTGDMVVGDAGSDDASDYTVLGDMVNLGARLESANKATGTRILATERTVELIGDDLFLWRPIGKFIVVGKSRPVMTYEPLAFTERATSQDKQLAELTAAMVERFSHAQFQACLDAIDQLEQTFAPINLTTLYRQLCQQYLEHPPAEGFTGQIELTEK